LPIRNRNIEEDNAQSLFLLWFLQVLITIPCYNIDRNNRLPPESGINFPLFRRSKIYTHIASNLVLFFLPLPPFTKIQLGSHQQHPLRFDCYLQENVLRAVPLTRGLGGGLIKASLPP
jgi:hypothetical protein